ncbi:MAG TPA: carboxypeptidase-like regulatory domain-containing protein, partial [Bacteroidia bacterium]|nr:carboxypeptidase-like regulatory domain-containing protein [Bacteroidia bacterium]
NSIGGYDIMYSTFKDNQWGEPTNIGYPINTTEDERFYVLAADGEHGYYSSNMKGGKGQQDIYSVTPGYFGEKPILALVVGTVFANDNPVDATINVTNAETGEKQGTYHSNASSGKYLIALTPGNNYKVAIEVEGYEAQIQYVNVKSLETFVQVQKDFKLYSDEYKKNNAIASVKDSSNVIQLQINDQIKRYNDERKAEIYEARVYQDIIRKYGEIKKECVKYYLEMGTFEKASDFNPAKVRDLGDIQERKDSLGTTFYFAGFNTLLEAEIFKYKVIDKDTSLKTVIVTVDDCNKRLLVQQYYSYEYTRKDYVAPKETKVIKEKKGIVALNSGQVETNIQKDQGTSEIAGLTYKLEVGAVENPDDFKLQTLSKYGKIESKKYPDGKIRYTMGPFKTLAEAEAFKKMIVEKEPASSQSFVTVFFFGVRKTLEEHNNPCNPDAPSDFSAFVGKDLNDKEVYNKLIDMAGNNCAEGLIFRVQIGAYRKPQNFKHKNLNRLEPPPALVTPYPDGITRFTMREFKTIKDAEAFRQECIRLGTTDAWITAFYNGNRMLLQELIANNFYNKKIN